jgi:UDP-2,4-diacetamido-2,4,6-trideoxy-beta-L-altropyranose hydrolase
MTAGHLLIRADANGTIGTGHIMRCLALAEAWCAKGGHALFVSHCESTALKQRIAMTGAEIVELDASAAGRGGPDVAGYAQLKLEATRRPPKDRWLVVDGYQFSESDYHAFRSIEPRLACIDDFAHLAFYDAAVVVNQNIHARTLVYHCRANAKVLLGSQYVLLRAQFLRWKNRPLEVASCARKILLTLGGSPAPEAAAKILRALRQSDVEDIEVKLLGGFGDATATMFLRELSAGGCRIEILGATADVAELMVWADVAIICAGGTLWELLFMGCPTMSFCRNRTQDVVLTILAEQGAVAHLGSLEQICEETVADTFKQFALSKSARLHASRCGREIIDGMGAERVVSTLLQTAGAQ